MKTLACMSVLLISATATFICLAFAHSHELTLPPANPDGRFINLLKFLHLHDHPEGSAAARSYEAFLFEPKNVEPNSRYPLIVWLHGGGILNDSTLR